jgi:membrane associated rhomboid family serine protease
MDQTLPPPPSDASAPTPGPVACKRHPDVQTMLRCTRCGDPICPDCMQPAAVGYQCPDCARRSRQEVHRPAQRVGAGPGRGLTLTNVILLILVGMYALEVVFGGAGSLFVGPSARVLVRLGASLGYGCTPSGEAIGIGAGETYRLFTAIFLHGGLIHIAMNGYALWAFGNIVEQELGRTRFLIIFLVGGLFASVASYTFGPATIPGVGASGAIFAVFGAFVGYSWRRRDLAFYASRIRNAVVLIVVNAVFSLTFPGIDWRAHAGGFVAGLLMGLAADGLGDRRSARVTFGVSAVVLVVVGTLAVQSHTATLQALYGGVC